jgi:hypothetical protein
VNPYCHKCQQAVCAQCVAPEHLDHRVSTYERYLERAPPNGLSWVQETTELTHLLNRAEQNREMQALETQALEMRALETRARETRAREPLRGQDDDDDDSPRSGGWFCLGLLIDSRRGRREKRL